MRYRIRTVVASAEDLPALAVSVDDFKAFAKITSSAEDTSVLPSILRRAQEMVEDFTGAVLTDRELEMITCGFPVLPELISIPRDPVTAILSIAYTDPSTGEAVELEAGDWRWSDTAPDQLLPPFRQAWPVAETGLGSVRIRLQAGYEAGLCPDRLLGAVKDTALALYDRRGSASCLPDEVREGLVSYRPLLA